VCLDDSAPDGSESGIVDGVLGLVDVGNSLSKVEGSVFLVTHTLDFQQSELLLLGGYTTLESSEYCLLVQSKNPKKVSQLIKRRRSQIKHT